MLARPTEVPQTPAFWGGWEVSGSGFLKGIPEACWRAAAVSEPGTWPPPESVWARLRPLQFCGLFSTGGHCLYVQRWGGVVISVGRPGSVSAVLPQQRFFCCPSGTLCPSHQLGECESWQESHPQQHPPLL